MLSNGLIISIRKLNSSWFSMIDSSTNKSEPPAVSTPTVKSKKKEKKQIASASTALMFGTVLGLLQAIFLAFGAKFLLNVMGVKQVSSITN